MAEFPLLNKSEWQKVQSWLYKYLEDADFDPLHSNESDNVNKGMIEAFQMLVSERENLNRSTVKIDESIVIELENIIELNRGHRIGKFVVDQKLAAGGMGTVYLAKRNEDIDQLVALKVIRKQKNQSERIELFDTERRTLAKLEHRNIARVIDAGENQEWAYFAMEWVDGDSITNYCKKNKLGLTQRLHLFLQACDAIAHAHEHFVAHLDIKPDNILVKGNGEVKVLDFGISKSFKDHIETSKAPNGVNVTAQYAAPEQFDQREVFKTSDIYSLGTLLYELVTDRQVYNIENLDWNEVLDTIKFKVPLLPSTVIDSDHPISAQKVKGDLDSIIMHAVEKNVKNRYPHVEEFSSDVIAYLNHFPIAIKTNNKAYVTKRFIQRNWLAHVTALAFSLLFLYTFFAIQFERDAALSAQHEAEMLSDTLINSFQVVNPEQSKGKNMKALDLVNNWYRHLNQLPIGSLSKAKIFINLAKVYRNLGDTKTALRILAVSETQIGRLNEETVIQFGSEYILNLLYSGEQEAEILKIVNQQKSEFGDDPLFVYTESVVNRFFARYRESIGPLRKILYRLPSSHGLYVPICSNLGFLLSSDEQYDEAKTVFRLCEDKIKEQPLMHIWELSEIKLRLGRLFIGEENFSQALESLKSASELKKTLVEDDSLSVAEVEIFISDALIGLGDYEAALHYAEAALKKRTLYVENNELTSFNTFLAKPLSRIGNYHMAKESWNKAKSVYTQVIQFRNVDGTKMSFNTALYYRKLGTIECQLNNFAVAFEHFKLSDKILKQDKYDAKTALLYNELAKANCFLLSSQGNQAREIINTIWPIIKTTYQPENLFYRKAMKIKNNLNVQAKDFY